MLAAQQYLGKLGHVANGVVAVTSHWADGSRHLPLGVKPYRPASRLPKGRKDPAFHTKPELAWELIAEARAAGIPFRLVVADAVYGERAQLEARLYAAHLPYVMGLRPSHGTWQEVQDEAHPPAFTPAEAAARLPLAAWQRTVHADSHGKQLIRYVAELELGPRYGPTKGVRLVAATLDPAKLKPESTWYLATSLPLREASPAQVYALYRLRDWIEHFYKPAKHELGWADYQVRPERAVVRHWHLVLLAYTFSLLVGAFPTTAPATAVYTASSSPTQQATGGGKIGPRPYPRVRGGRSSGAPRCGGCAAGCARGHTCGATGRAGRAPPHRLSWPRCSPTSPAPSRWRHRPPRSDQPPAK